MTTNEKLDNVLNYLYKAYKEERVFEEYINEDGWHVTSFKTNDYNKHKKDIVQIGIQALNDNIQLKELKALLRYLESEKLIISEQKDKISLSKKYTLQFVGLIFVENGGFKGKYERENAERERIEQLELTQIKQAKNMTWLTIALVLVSIPTSIYSLILLIEKKYLILSFEITTIILVLLFGVMGGLIISLLIREIRSKP